jgi:hypothetical protein
VTNGSFDNARSPFSAEISWWKEKDKSVKNLPKVPRNTADTLGVRKTGLKERIASQLNTYASLEARWQRKRVEAAAKKVKDDAFYGESDELEGLGITQVLPYVLDVGKSSRLLLI